MGLFTQLHLRLFFYILVVLFVSIIVFVFFFLFVFRFPVFDDDLLILGSQIDRSPRLERVIEFFDIVASDILLATCHEVSLHHIGERINQDIEWLLILVIVSFFVWTHCLLECVDDLCWLARIAEYE